MIGEQTLAVILGGGAGTRLYPLTKDRSKPAVPVAGKFRLIDIPISNCLNSGIKRMYVLTQFNSASLNKHVKNAYNFDRFSDAFVDILAAEQTPDSMEWFQGTADAVRQSVQHLLINDFKYLMILSGDQLYQMDLNTILNHHIEKGADLTVATIPVVDKDAPGFGIMKVNEDEYIDEFVEKPNFDELSKWSSPVDKKYADEGKIFLASMGIYVFTKGVLQRLFDENPEATDFGKEIIPYAVEKNDYTVTSFPYGGYWTDIGSIASFFEANLELTEFLPQFNLYDNIKRVYTGARMLAPSKVFGTMLNHVLISEGCIIHAKEIHHAIIGLRSRIGKHTIINKAIVMGMDFYQSLAQVKQDPDMVLLGIGENCHIENAIIDKNVKIGDDCSIIGSPELADEETPEYCIRNGIIIVKKGAVIPPNSKIGLVK